MYQLNPVMCTSTLGDWPSRVSPNILFVGKLICYNEQGQLSQSVIPMVPCDHMVVEGHGTADVSGS